MIKNRSRGLWGGVLGGRIHPSILFRVSVYFDLALIFCVAILSALLVAWYFGEPPASRTAIPPLVGLILFGVIVTSYYGHFIPLVVFAAVLVVSARKSTVGARFCGVFATAFGAVMLFEVASGLFGPIGHSAHWWKQVRLPWSLGIGSLWMAGGVMLFAFGRLPGIGRWVLSSWATRFGGVATLLPPTLVTLSWVDASSYRYTDWSERGYPHYDPPTLASWWNASIEWVSGWLVPFDTVAVGPSIVALVLTLALVGIRRGTIGLPGIRITLLLLGLVHALVMSINFTRLAMEGRLSIFLRHSAEPFGYPYALAFTALCLGVGSILHRIRSEWWERTPNPAPLPSITP